MIVSKLLLGYQLIYSRLTRAIEALPRASDTEPTLIAAFVTSLLLTANLLATFRLLEWVFGIQIWSMGTLGDQSWALVAIPSALVAIQAMAWLAGMIGNELVERTLRHPWATSWIGDAIFWGYLAATLAKNKTKR